MPRSTARLFGRSTRQSTGVTVTATASEASSEMT